MMRLEIANIKKDPIIEGYVDAGFYETPDGVRVCVVERFQMDAETILETVSGQRIHYCGPCGGCTFPAVAELVTPNGNVDLRLVEVVELGVLSD